MDAIDLILTKRDGGRLSDEQIDWFIRSYTDGTIVEEQAAALLMAILFRGLDSEELVRWTQQMIATGSRADLSSLVRPTVDKHSTGGVGDKVSLILCPLIAACGAAVPQLTSYMQDRLGIAVSAAAPSDLMESPAQLLAKAGNPAMTVAVGLARFGGAGG